MNGTINTGFNTIGVPKIIGSLILKQDGKKHVFPKELAYFDLERNANKIANPIVQPDPPIQINHWKNGSAAIAVGACPAATATVLASINCNHNGLASEPIIETP